MHGIFRRLATNRPRGDGNSLEDFFTELWGFVLTRDDALARAVLDVIGFRHDGKKIAIETQVEYPAAALAGARRACYPDLRITADAKRLLCEHKIDADQHDEVVMVDGAVREYSQLERYLAVDENACVAFITLAPARVAPAVLRHPRYLRPTDKPHFTWSDFHAAVAARASHSGSDPFVVELLRFMDDLEMRPPRPGVGMLPSANLPGLEAERRAHARGWWLAIELLRESGWTLRYHSLEIQLDRSEVRSNALHLDMRAGEKVGVRDGRLMAKLRFDEAGREAAVALAAKWRERGFEASVLKSRTSDGTRCIDAVCLTLQPRPVWIGDGDLATRLRDFARAIVEPIHDLLALPPPIR